MNKMEATTSQVIGKAGTNSDKSAIWADFMALIKVGIINSNLMTAFTGFCLALYFSGQTLAGHWDVLTFTLGGTAFVIAGGCVLNNFYDRDIDPVMARTRKRPTVTGSIPASTVLGLGVAFTAIGFILLMLTTIQAAIIGAFGWFTYVVLYTMWSKRRYTINTAVGSFSGAVPPLIGWTAVTPTLDTTALAVFIIMFIWQTPHFLALAIKKKEEYKKAGVPMLPVVHGFDMTRRQIVLYVACLLPLPFYLSELGPVFLLIAGLLNLGWLILGISGFFMADPFKWANWMFIYSLNYLMILFITMAVVTLPAVIN